MTPRPAHPSRTQHALQDLYPKHLWIVPPTILLSAGLLFKGLSLPLLYSQKLLWKNTYSVWTGIVELWKQNELGLATLLFFFSIVFPIVKLIALGIIWFVRLPAEKRIHLLQWLEILGKWSMLDVFVVAILIVLVKLGPFVKIEPRDGVYVFASAILVSMLTTMYVARLAHRSIRPS